MTMARRNILAGAVLLVIALAYAILTAALPDRSLPNTPGPAFLPWLITAGWIILSTALLVRGLIEARDETEGASGYQVPTRAWPALLAFVAYLALLPTLGFVATSVFFFAGLMWLYGERNKLLVLAASILVPVALFYLFTAGFQVLLPRGLW